MSTVETTPVAEGTKRRAIRPREADQCVTLPGVGWGIYRRMLRSRGDRTRPRMIYLDGDLFLMSPGHLHEADRDRFGIFVPELAVALNIPLHMAGSTTYRRRKNKGGIEPDRSYYLANAQRVQGKTKIDLRIDPPPDLSIEVVYSHSAAAAVEVSRRFGIPEIWICSERGLKYLLLDPNGKYAESATSRAFPFISADEVISWIRRPLATGETDTDWIKDLRRWIQETLLPRVTNRPE